MLFRIIDKTQLSALVRGFAQRYEVIGPVREKDHFTFSEVGTHPDDLAIDYDTTLLPPRRYLLGPRQVLFDFDTARNTVTDAPIHVTPRVLFGLHSCDINGIDRLDRVFLDSEFNDPYYRSQREATLIVGVSCEPTANCMCDLWGTDEVASGYDMFLHDIGDRYLVTITSVEAAEILSASTVWQAATEADSAALSAHMRRFKAAFPEKTQHVDQLALMMDALYDDGLWDDLGSRCLSCSACAMVCPTCQCFDIRDELAPDGATGQRVRVWDACTSPAFSTVTGGHNFRGNAGLRIKNRFYHKFLGYPSRFGSVMCVGCGRCAGVCKADISPRTVLAELSRGLGEDCEVSR